MKVGDLCRIKYRRLRFNHEKNGWLVIITKIYQDTVLGEDFVLVKGVWVKSGNIFEDHHDFLQKLK